MLFSCAILKSNYLQGSNNIHDTCQYTGVFFMTMSLFSQIQVDLKTLAKLARVQGTFCPYPFLFFLFAHGIFVVII